MYEKLMEAAKTFSDLTSITSRCILQGEYFAYFSSVPTPEGMEDPFLPYLSNLPLLNNPVNCMITPNRFLFGILPYDACHLVIGPVRDSTVSENWYLQIAKNLSPDGEVTDEFADAIKACPQMSLHSLAALLTNLHELIQFSGGELPSKKDPGSSLAFADITFLDFLSEEVHLTTSSLERICETLIENGDVAAMRDWFSQEHAIHFCYETTGNAVRDRKDNFIILATLMARAAANGGLDRAYSMQMELNAIRRVEKMTRVSDILDLQESLALSYAIEVHKRKKLPVRSRLIEETIQYIQRNISRPLPASEIAKKMSVGRSSLSRRFHEETGFTLSEYISRTRIEEAKKLLANPGLSLAQISTALSFSSQGYFTNVFKKFTGMTPLQYRNRPFNGTIDSL